MCLCLCNITFIIAWYYVFILFYFKYYIIRVWKYKLFYMVYNYFNNIIYKFIN